LVKMATPLNFRPQSHLKVPSGRHVIVKTWGQTPIALLHRLNYEIQATPTNYGY